MGRHHTGRETMVDLQSLIYEAWDKLRDHILSTPAELQKRLARRASKSFRSPPRAWCLVVRASDRRIDDYYGRRSAWQGFHGTQEIELTPRLVRKLNHPVFTEKPYDTQLELAEKLGVCQGMIQLLAQRNPE